MVGLRGTFRRKRHQEVALSHFVARIHDDGDRGVVAGLHDLQYTG
jgi:hypothetical protein